MRHANPRLKSLFQDLASSKGLTLDELKDQLDNAKLDKELGEARRIVLLSIGKGEK